MAKKITKDQVIDDNILGEHINQSKELLNVYKQLDTQIKQTAKTAKAGLKTNDANTAKGIREVNAEVSNSIKLRKASVDIEKKQEQLKREQLKTETALLNQKKKADLVERKRLKTLRDSTSLYKQQSRELADLSRRFKELSLAGRGSGKVARGLLVDIKRLNAGLVKADVATGKFGRNVGNYPSVLGSVKGALTSLINPATLATGAIFALGTAIKSGISFLREFDEALADIQKTTGLSKDVVKTLSLELSKLDTRTPISALQELAVSAGRLGIKGVENIKGFVNSADKLFVALGDDINGTGEEIATMIGKIASLGGVIEEFGVEKGLLKVGSVINELAANTKASAEEIVNFTNRVGGIANILDIPIQDMSALGATFADAGLSMEVSGTHIGNTLASISKNMGAFAKLSGLSLADFKKKFEEDALGTLRDLTVQAKESGEGLAGFTDLLSTLGVKGGARVTQVLATLAVTQEEFTKNQLLANEAFREGTSLTDEFDTKNNTLNASFEKLSNSVASLFLNLAEGQGDLSIFLKDLVDGATALVRLVNGIEQTDEALRKLPFGDTIVRFKNLGDTWGNAFNSLEDFGTALKDTGFAMLSLLGVSDESIKTFETLDTVWKDGFNSLEDFGNSIFTTFSAVGEAIASVFGGATGVQFFNAQITILQTSLNSLLGTNLKLVKTAELLSAEQREANRVTRIASKNITNLEQETGALIVAEQNRIQGLIDGNLSQEDRNKLINELTEKYPELIENYDLENLTQEQAVELQKELRKEIAETTILKQKSLAITLLNNRVEQEQFKINQISNQKVREQKQAELDFEQKRQLQRIDNIEQEVRNQLGLNTVVQDANDDTTENAINNDSKRVSSYKSSSEKIIDQAEIEEKRLFDLRNQQQKDVEDNDKENDKIREDEKKKAQKALDEKNKQQEEADQQLRDREKRLAEERLQRQKENFQALTDLLNSTLEIQQSKIDSQIEDSKNTIAESQTAVSNLQEQANLGNLDAQSSIKAEKQKIANEKENIDALEKKRRNLQILVTGLAVANEKVQNGDGNALANAGTDMANFISNLKGFYNGTETTLGADLGNAYAITGDRDTHIIKAHKDETIIGVDNSRKLGGMNQEEIVQGALMLKNGDFVGRRAINAVNQVDVFNDSRMISAMSEVKKRLTSDTIYKYQNHFNYDALFSKMATEKNQNR